MLDIFQPEGGRDNTFRDLKEPSQLAHSGTIRRTKVKSKKIMNLDKSDSDDFDDLINFFQEKEGGKSDKPRLSENPFSALLPTMEVAQCYNDSHKWAQ